MAINADQFSTDGKVKSLFMELREFKMATLPSIVSSVSGSLNSENAIRAYYQIKKFVASVESVTTSISSVDIDRIYARETGKADNVAADITKLMLDAKSFLAIVETNQAAIFDTMTLGQSFPAYGNLTAAQRNALMNSINTLAGNFTS